MKIRTALTLKNTCATAAVFLACLTMIYLVSEHTRSKTFFHDLSGEAITKAHLFLRDQVDARTMQSISTTASSSTRSRLPFIPPISACFIMTPYRTTS